MALDAVVAWLAGERLLVAAVAVLVLERFLTYLGVLRDAAAPRAPSNLISPEEQAKNDRARERARQLREAQQEALNEDVLPASALRLTEEMLRHRAPAPAVGNAAALTAVVPPRGPTDAPPAAVNVPKEEKEDDNTAAPHRGVSIPAPVPDEILTPEVVAQHVCSNDMWMTLENRVLNITPFLACHPGGPSALKKWRGKDATRAFYDVSLHTDPTRKKEMKKYFKMMYVGDLGTAYKKTPL